MKPKRFWLVRPLNIMLIAISLVMCGVLFFANRLLFFIFTPIVLLLDILAAVRIWRIQQDLHKVITSMGKAVSDRNEAGLIHFPIPSLLVSLQGEIVWYNEMFRATVLNNKQDIFGYALRSLIEEDLSDLLARSPHR